MMNRIILIFVLSLLLVLFFISATCTRKGLEKKYLGFPEVLIPDGIGVNIHFAGAPEKDLKLIKKAQIKLIRADLTWGWIERKKHEYDFSRYDSLIDAFENQGARMLFILDYSNRLYGKERAIKSDEQRKAFARFASEAVKRYKGKGVIWEIWNEPNIAKFWGEEPNAANYMALLTTTCKAIRKADLNSIIVAPATVGFDPVFIKKCAELGLFDLVDGVSVHPYRKGGPESVINDYKNLRHLIKKFSPKGKREPRILSSEWGWPLGHLGLMEKGRKGAEMKQAAYLTRRFCVEAYAGVASAIYYKWRENDCGMIRSNYVLKPSYTAFKVLNEQLTGYCNKVLRLDIGDKDKDFILVFKGTSGKKLVVWRTEGSEIVSIPYKGKEAKGVDFLGKPVEFEIKNNMLDIELTEQPVFVEY